VTLAAKLVFDLDGTISDPLVGIHRSYNHALARHGYDEVPEPTIARLIGPPLDEGFRSLIPDADDELVGRLVSTYRERYADVGYAENTLYDGMTDVLETLARRGVPVGVCTSKRVDFAERILEMFGIRQFIGFVSGGDIGARKGLQLASLLRDSRVVPESLMIGDRGVDVRAAGENGMPAAGVLWGYGSEAELREAGAALVLHEVRDILRLPAAE